MGAVPVDEPALRLTVDFINTYDLLDDPADRLTSELAATLAAKHGFEDLSPRLDEADLAALQALRGQVYAVFEAPAGQPKLRALNALLAAVDARPEVVAGPRLMLTAAGADAVAQLGAICADALTRTIVTGGEQRLGVCEAHPCRCGFLDRTRPGRQRYCCELCNDRMAAAAYRSRRRQTR